MQLDQNVVWFAEFLDGNITEAKAAKIITQRIDIGRTIGLDFNQNTATEIDAKVKTLGKEHANGCQHHYQRNDIENLPEFKERDVHVIRDKM